MKGFQLRSLTGELHKVRQRDAKSPAQTIIESEKKFGHWWDYICKEFEGRFSFPADCRMLGLRAFAGFSFDELCKIHYSSIIMMDRSVTHLFETSARFEVIRKIENSMWRWGVGKGTWNEVAEAYDRIRTFSFDQTDFEVRLDYTTYFNPYGCGKCSRTYLDGVFAYLVYYKCTHVMTISFSIQEKKHLLIQQVQTTARSGNRWLYQLPANRLEYVIGLFEKYFPGYRLWVIDGNSLVEKTLADYQRGCEQMQRVKDEDGYLAFRSKVAHLEADKPRLAAFYRNTGRYVSGPSRKVNGLIHHRVCSH